MKKNFNFKLGLIAGLIAGISGSAQSADESDEMKLLTKPDSSLSIGLGYVDKDRPQLGKYDGMEKDGAYLGLSADVRKRNDADGTWLNFSTKDLGLETREAAASYSQQGNWGVGLDYSRTPSRNPNTYFTGVSGIGGSTLTYGGVGSGTTSANATADAQTKLNPATQEVHLGTRRDTAGLSFYKYFNPNLSFNASFKNEEKNGTRSWGRGSNLEFAVEPINSVTRQLEAVLNFTEEKFQLAAGLNASWYKNKNSFVDTIGGSQTNVTVANGFSRTNGHTFLSLPMDNEAYQIFANGGYNFSSTTRATFKAAYTKATQNESLGDLTNAVIGSGALFTNGVVGSVPSSLDGRVDTKLFELGLSTKPMDKLSLVGSLRYQDRKDKTPLREFADYWTFRCSGAGTTSFAQATQPVTGAACPPLAAGIGTVTAVGQSNVQVENDPRDFKNLAAKVEATYRLPQGYALTGGVNWDRRERGFEINPATGQYTGPVKMRGKTEETTYNLQVRRALAENVSGTVAYQHSNRDGSSWAVAQGSASALLPINFVNPAPFADRKRDKLRFMVDWSPVEAATIQFNFEGSKDKYGADRAGVKDGSTQLLSLDGTYAINDNWKLNGWASHDISKTHHVGYTFDTRQTAAPNWDCSSAPGAAITGGCTTDLIWDARLKDTGNSIGIGLVGKAGAKWTLGADVQWTETKSAYPMDSNIPDINTATVKSKQGLPEIKNTLTKFAFFGEYALEKNADVRIDLIHQRWTTNDWTWSEWNTAGTSMIPFTYMDGTRVVTNPVQSSTFVGARYIYKFQ